MEPNADAILVTYLYFYAEQGIVRNMKVAIKKLSRIDDFSEKQFEDELKCLKRVKHKNIVRFLGYCSDTPKEVVVYKGAYVLAECRKRFLCFEYAPNKSLEDYMQGIFRCWFFFAAKYITVNCVFFYIVKDKTRTIPGIIIVSSILLYFYR